MQRGRGAISIQVKADVDRSSFAGALAAEKALGGSEDFKVKADVDASSFARARAGMAVLTKESNKLGDVFNRSNLSIGQWTGILASALPVIVDLTGALGALTASAAAATAGLGALAVGGVGVAAVGFGGIAAIAAPAIKSLGDLMTAQTSLNKARSTGSAAAARSAVSSAQQITTAETALANAQRSEKIAQDSLNLAREEAIRQLEDMKRAALESGTSEKRARLSLRQAEQNLRDLRKQQGVSALDIRDAELSIVEARQNVKDVSIQAQRSQEDYNKAQRDGVSKMPQVVSAQRSYDDAVRATAQANQALAQAQEESNAAAGAGATQLAALRLAQKKAGPEAVKFAQSLKDLGHRWKELTAAGKTDFFGLLNDGLERTNQRLPLFAKSANESMKALREGVDAFWAKAAAGPEFKTFIRTMTDTFHKALVPIGEGFGNIVKVLERISVAVAPDLLRLFRGFDEMTQGWVDSTRNATQLREVIHGLVNQANTWWKLLKATFNLLTAVLIPGMGKGKMAIEGITASLNEWTAWVEGHPAAMRDFFKEGLETTKQLAALLLGLLPTLFQISTAMRPIARAFLALLKGLNSLKIGNVSALTVLLGAMVSAKIVKGIAGLVKSFQALKTAALGAAAAEAAAGSAGAVSGPAQMGLASGAAPKQMGLASAPVVAPTGVKALVASTGGLANFAKVAGGAALAITALVGAVEALRTNFLGVRSVFEGFFTRVLRPLNDAFTELLNTVSGGHAGEVFGAFGKALQTLAKPLAFVVRNLTKFIGLLAIGGISAAFVTAIVAIVGPLYVAIKALTLMIKGLKSLKDVAKTVSGVLVSVFTAAFAKIKQVFTAGTGVALGAFKRFAGGIRDAASGIAHIFRSLYLVIKKVATWIGNQVNKVGNALGGLKDKIPDLSIDIPGPLDVAKGILGQQKGGLVVPALATGGLAGVVPGTAPGDRHILTLGGRPIAKVESREGIFVGNRDLMAVLKKMNAQVPRKAGGGDVPKLAKGGMAAMIAEANRFERRDFPYVWGGGHGSFGVQPVDCSGAVSDILHAAGLLKAPMTSGSLMSWGKPGKGPLTVYANPDHTVMSLNGRVFGTSGSNPNKGAGWIDGASGKSLAPGAVRTMDVAGAIGQQIKKLLVKGKGPVKDVAQAVVNRMRKMANAKLAKMAPAGEFGGGQADIYKGNLDTVFPHPGGPTIAAWQAAMLAEKAGLPGITYAQIAKGESTLHPGAISDDGGYGLWQMTPRVQSASTVAAWKRIGSYFNPWDNARMAKFLAGSGTGVSNYFGTGFWDGSIKHWHGEKKFARGGIAGPYVGKFHDGGFVGQDGLGLLQRGEMVLPGLQKGGSVAPSIPRDLIRGLRHLVHFTPEDSRKERRQEARLLRRIARTDGVKQLNLISKVLGKYGVDFTKAEEKRLRKLSRDQAHGGGLTEEQHGELRHLRRERSQSQEQKDIREQIAVQREMIAEFKEYQRDAKERNRMLREIRAAGNQPMKAVSNYIASDIGFSQRQKARQASAGNVARY